VRLLDCCGDALVFSVRDHPPVSIAVEQVDPVAPFVLRYGKGSEAADFDAIDLMPRGSCRLRAGETRDL
jgi:hypothetical protein